MTWNSDTLGIPYSIGLENFFLEYAIFNFIIRTSVQNSLLLTVYNSLLKIPIKEELDVDSEYQEIDAKEYDLYSRIKKIKRKLIYD